ncbi:hypothetical protein EIP91_009173 [Steccherinum ochraceum]|uniref:Uncharacterized protein n=1 Tax=Steccherinum ochraceum TaxID=92696 RepID=A0A4R0R4M3_9APHY|nr:hypothetical protein EIP91_009173 [Steccherinum ochraceum]
MPEAQYELSKTFENIKDCVLSLSFSAFGSFICASGFNGVSCWNLASMAPIHLPSDLSVDEISRVYPICAWLYFVKTSQHVLLLGTYDGSVVAWDLVSTDGTESLQRRRQPAPDVPEANASNAVTSMSVGAVEVPDGRRGRIAACFFNKSICVWTMTADGGFQTLWRLDTLQFTPVTVAYREPRRLWVFALTGGEICVFHSEKGTVVESKTNGPEVMKHVTLDSESDVFAICAARNTQLFNLDSLTFIRQLEDPVPPTVLYPKQVAFTEECTKVVAGTDRGVALVFDCATGVLVQTLPAPSCKLVQTVAACAVGDLDVVAVAGSTQTQPSALLIWHKARETTPEPQDTPVTPDVFVLRIPRAVGRYLFWSSALALAVLAAVLAVPYERINISEVGPRIHEWLEHLGLPGEVPHTANRDLSHDLPNEADLHTSPIFPGPRETPIDSAERLSVAQGLRNTGPAHPVHDRAVFNRPVRDNAPPAHVVHAKANLHTSPIFSGPRETPFDNVERLSVALGLRNTGPAHPVHDRAVFNRPVRDNAPPAHVVHPDALPDRQVYDRAAPVRPARPPYDNTVSNHPNYDHTVSIRPARTVHDNTIPDQRIHDNAAPDAPNAPVGPAHRSIYDTPMHDNAIPAHPVHPALNDFGHDDDVPVYPVENVIRRSSVEHESQRAVDSPVNDESSIPHSLAEHSQEDDPLGKLPAGPPVIL